MCADAVFSHLAMMPEHPVDVHAIQSLVRELCVGSLDALYSLYRGSSDLYLLRRICGNLLLIFNGALQFGRVLQHSQMVQDLSKAEKVTAIQ